jgi:glycosyltransferase involved in cell wall biosynthesis
MQMLPWLLLLPLASNTAGAAAPAAGLPTCLTVLQPSGITPLSLHAGEDGTGKTSVVLRYAISGAVGTGAGGTPSAPPDLSTPGVEWRVHIYTQHTSISMPIDLTATSGSGDGGRTQSWKIPTDMEPGFRVGTHFLKASLLEFPQGCRNRALDGHDASSECDDVRHAERLEEEEEEEEEKYRDTRRFAPRRLICATATRVFDVRLDARHAMIQAKALKAAIEHVPAETRPHGKSTRGKSTRKRRRPLRIVFLSGLTNDGQSTHLFQLLPRLLSDPASFQVSLLFPKSSADQLHQNRHAAEEDEAEKEAAAALDWSLDAASRFNNKRHLIPAADMQLYRRARALLSGLRNGDITKGTLLPYEMRGWTVREFQDAGGLAGIVQRLQRVPAGRPERMAPSDRRSLESLMAGMRGADVVHYTHIPEQALENQLLVQSARIMGVQRIVCEPGRWHDDTLDSADAPNQATSHSITDVIGPSAASCARWFSNLMVQQAVVEVDASAATVVEGIVRSGPGPGDEAVARAQCHVLPVGADVDVNDIGPQQQQPTALKPGYRVPFEELQSGGGGGGGGGDRPKVVIVVIGRLAAIKSPGMIMRAAALLQQEMQARRKLEDGVSSIIPRFVVEFWGDGPLLDLLAGTLALELGLAVERRDAAEKDDEGPSEDNDVLVSFEGWVPHETIHSRLQTSVDVVLHSSFEETYCASNVEALAAGRVLLTFGTAGVSEYLQRSDQHGVVVWPPTPASMVAALLAIVDAPDTARVMGRAAEEYVVAEGLVRDRTIDRAVQFYRYHTQDFEVDFEVGEEDPMSAQQSEEQ